MAFLKGRQKRRDRRGSRAPFLLLDKHVLGKLEALLDLRPIAKVPQSLIVPRRDGITEVQS